MRSRHYIWRNVAAALTLVFLTGGPARPQAQGATTWPFHLEWEHTGPGGALFQLCVDGTCAPLAAVRRGGDTWRAPLSLLPQGEHRLVVQACGTRECLEGTPDLVVRVLPASPRRPPIDVIEGPRIPVGRR